MPDRFADDGFSRGLADLLEERVSRINGIITQDQVCTRGEVARFIWSTVKATRKQIRPEEGGRRADAWRHAKGMLKELVDFDKFTPALFREECIKYVFEKKIAEVLDRYRNFVMTGEVKTKYPPPKLLGETDLILCVDKPCQYICSYGGHDKKPPQCAGAQSASALLNGERPEIQIHEYLALKYNYQTAVETREWWKKKMTELECCCGMCSVCACTQAGCCNRLDKETSGVMIAAKTVEGFPEVRKQFQSEHSVDKGGTEKYYLALARGTVSLPTREVAYSDHWNHRLEDDRGRIGITMVWDSKQARAWPTTKVVRGRTGKVDLNMKEILKMTAHNRPQRIMSQLHGSPALRGKRSTRCCSFR